MSKSTHLFIGGPEDGEWKAVPEKADEFYIEEDSTIYKYVKVLLQEEAETYAVFIIPEIKPLQALITGYGRL